MAVQEIISQCVFCIVMIASQTAVVKTDHLVIPPKQLTKDQCLLVIFPEEGVRKENYNLIGNAFIAAAQHSVSVWIVIAEYSGNNRELVSEEVPTIIDNVMKNLMASHKVQQPMNTFLVGHGSSGVPVQDYVDMNPYVISGLILLGAEIREGPLLPVPVMMLSGELDGILRLSRIAHAFKKYYDLSQNKLHTMMRNPVIVIENVNHGSYSNGSLSKHSHDLDIKIAQSPTISSSRIAEAVISYVLFILGLPENGESSTSTRKIYKELLNTKEIVKPFIDLEDLTFNDDTKYSEWIRHAQIWLSGVPRVLSAKLQVESLLVLGSADFSPLMYKGQTAWNIYSWVKIVHRTENGVNASLPVAPDMIKAQMIDGVKINHKLGIIDQLNISLLRKCRDINYASFLTAYHTASQEARQRYDSTDPGIIFQDDHEVTSEDEWNSSRLSVNRIGRVYYVRSSSWKRKFELNDDSTGTIYCTLLPPNRALEWIYTDSLK